jgi:hypothetical protein
MRAPALLWSLVPAALITGLGAFWADALWWHKDSGVRAWVEGVPLLDHILDYLHFPAKVLFVASAYLRLGPGGEAGWVILPICMVVQWTVIGLVVGFWLAKRSASKKGVANGSSD